MATLSAHAGSCRLMSTIIGSEFLAQKQVAFGTKLQQSRGFYSAHMPTRQLRKLCALDDAGSGRLKWRSAA